MPLMGFYTNISPEAILLFSRVGTFQSQMMFKKMLIKQTKLNENAT
jgi:hypothetical protein